MEVEMEVEMGVETEEVEVEVETGLHASVCSIHGLHTSHVLVELGMQKPNEKS